MRRAAPVANRRVSLKLALFGAVTVVLLGVVLLAITREMSAPDARPAAAASANRMNVLAPRPAMAPDEQRYVESLWPIHTQVERSAVRLALGAAFYQLKDIDRVELKSRLDEARGVWQSADERISALAPPPSLEPSHNRYLAGVRLFQVSASEMLKMYDDGDDEHVVDGFPLSQQGSDRIREVGSQLFPDQYPPN